MKGRITNDGGVHLHGILTPGCWTSVGRKEKGLRRLLRCYQGLLDTLFAAAAIGLMFLTGSWLFLAELAELGL